MVYEVVGIQLVNYYSNRRQAQVVGVTLFIMGDRDGVKGKHVDSIWIPCDSPLYNDACSLAIGVKVNPLFNRFGKLGSYNLVK